jgi:hypothetical protein
MANEVVARYLDGRVVKGVSLDVDPARPVCHIRTGQGSQEVKLKELKALFFVKDLLGDAARDEVLKLIRPFFFVLPADTRSNNVRVLATKRR